MSDMRPDDEIEPLLADAGWLSALAHRLVSDAAAADDAVQQTWLRALRAQRGAVASPRGYLATILRRVLSRQSEQRELRARAERRASRDEELRSDERRLEAQRLLYEQIAKLDDEDRRLIVSRYLDGRSPREMAQDLGLEASTLRSRLNRALERLRTAVRSARHRDGDLMHSLIPLALGATGKVPVHMSASSSLERSGVMSMKSYVVVGVIFASLMGSAAWFVLDHGARDVDVRTAGPSSSREIPDARRDVTELTAAGANLAGSTDERGGANGTADTGAKIEDPATPSSQESTTNDAPPKPTDGTISGRIENADGDGVPDVLVFAFDASEQLPDPPARWADESQRSASGKREARAKSDAEGNFILEGLAPGRYRIALQDVVVDEQTPIHATGSKDVVVLVPITIVKVRVIDASGKPLADARVKWAEYSLDVDIDRIGREEALTTGEESGSEGDAVEIMVSPECRLVVQAVDEEDDTLFSERKVVEVRRDRLRYAVDLVCHRDHEKGTLRIDLDFGADADDGDTTVSVTRVLTSINARHESGRTVGIDHVLPPLLPGEYDLRIDHGDPYSSFWLPVDDTVTVSSGRETVYEKRMERGGRLKLAIHSTPDGPSVVPANLATQISKGGEPFGVIWRRVQKDRVLLYGEALTFDLPIDAVQALPVGTYEMDVSAPDVRSQTIGFVIRVGETTTVDLRLERAVN